MNQNPTEFWNLRYGNEEFIYGEKPNKFFKEQLDKLKPASILLPAEGEGRNAVYAASRNWYVVAFDISENARKRQLDYLNKAMLLSIIKSQKH